jgi:hypothetical protein
MFVDTNHNNGVTQIKNVLTFIILMLPALSQYLPQNGRLIMAVVDDNKGLLYKGNNLN